MCLAYPTSQEKLEETALNDTQNIAIADRNPHIRDFLCAEFAAAGYRVLGAKDGNELLRILNSGRRVDLLILDPECNHIRGLPLLKWVKERQPTLPVVIHTYNSEIITYLSAPPGSVVVEKAGDNINYLKSTVDRLLRSSTRKKGEPFPGAICMKPDLEPLRSISLFAPNTESWGWVRKIW